MTHVSINVLISVQNRLEKKKRNVRQSALLAEDLWMEARVGARGAARRGGTGLPESVSTARRDRGPVRESAALGSRSRVIVAITQSCSLWKRLGEGVGGRWNGVTVCSCDRLWIFLPGCTVEGPVILSLA